MDGADDLAAIDALQVDAGDPKVGVAIMRVILSSAIGLVVCERGTEEAVGPLLGERSCLGEVDRDGRVADGEGGE